MSNSSLARISAVSPIGRYKNRVMSATLITHVFPSSSASIRSGWWTALLMNSSINRILGAEFGSAQFMLMNGKIPIFSM